jgi:hypothetical protein
MSDEKPQAKTTAEKIADMKAFEQNLAQQERTTGSSGLIPLAPKQQLLDARQIEKDNPDKRFRWVNVHNSERAQLRQAQGYERVPVAEGGRQVGNLALFAVPRQKYDERVAQLEKTNKERLTAHQTEVERIADGVAKELRDRHGIKVDAERIMIRE